ncbi:MAG: DNA internalization-related competence protein ComEC/Rec2 [Lachnospiraceae bacterium]|nr:DNA internalization-related competence protein ComEC/Rec2 [Lachnospiraceae bacterium]MDE6185224.1 DNA internalization-related competence protein ComEC/Rec2 [Lachnospiraceae bacterium]
MAKRPLCFACLMLSAVLYLIVSIKPAPYQDFGIFVGEMITVEGRVYKKEIVRQTKEPVTVLYLKLFSSESGEQREKMPVSRNGKVICYLKSGQIEPEMGSIVRLKGKLASFERASNPGQFDAYSYYQILGISYRLNQAVISAKSQNYNSLTQKAYQIRRFFSRKLSENLPEQEAAMMQTMLLGEKEGMDKELKALYQRNGIAHILAISGLHISMLGMGLYKLLRKCGVPMKAAAAASALAMVLYCTMTGFSVSAIRAVIMFSLQMGAVITERTYDMLSAVAVAAVLILINQPLYLKHSGFLFSFGCVLGIGLIIPALTEGKQTIYPAVKKLLGSIAMMTVTLPIYLWFYYQFPVYSVLLNLLVIPLMSFLMAAGLLLLACSILCPPAVLPFVLLIKGILRIYEETCTICDMLPGSILTSGRPQIWQMVLYLSFLFLIALIKKKGSLILRWGIALSAVFLMILPTRSGLRITFLDVGQGDCICIKNEYGNSYLVDGGSSSVSNVGEYRIMPFLKSQGISCLEAVFITHPDEDHCNGIKELIETGKLQGIMIKNLVLPDISQNAKEEAYLELEHLAALSGIPVSYISTGQKITDNQLTITCLHPTKGYTSKNPNEYSTVLSLASNNFSAMLTGDIEGEGEQMLIRFLQKEKTTPITILKVAHHGSKYSTENVFLKTTSPRIALISAGKNNPYGHPHSELVDRLIQADCQIYQTNQTGALTVLIKNDKMTVKTFFESMN